MKSARYRHKDTNRRLHGWTRGVMADTLTSRSRRRGSALALVNLACTSQIDSWTGQRQWDRFHCLDGVVLDADANAACNILAGMHDDEITLYMSRGGQGPVRGTNQAVGGDCPPRTRVAGACNGAPINRERITGVGTEVCRLMEQTTRATTSLRFRKALCCTAPCLTWTGSIAFRSSAPAWGVRRIRCVPWTATARSRPAGQRPGAGTIPRRMPCGSRGGRRGPAGTDRGLLPGVRPGPAGRSGTPDRGDGGVRPGRGRGRMAVGNRGRPGLPAPGVSVADGTHRDAGISPGGTAAPSRSSTGRACRRRRRWSRIRWPSLTPSPVACRACAPPAGRSGRRSTMARPAKVTRSLHGRDPNRAKYDRLVAITALCGRVRGDAWQRCSGWSTARQTPRGIRDAWMADGCDRHGLPAVPRSWTHGATSTPAGKQPRHRSGRPSGAARKATKRNATACIRCRAEPPGRGCVPAPADAEAVAGRRCARDQPDRAGAQGLHHQGPA